MGRQNSSSRLNLAVNLFHFRNEITWQAKETKFLKFNMSLELKANFIDCSSKDDQAIFLCQHKNVQKTLLHLPIAPKPYVIFLQLKCPPRMYEKRGCLVLNRHSL